MSQTKTTFKKALQLLTAREKKTGLLVIGLIIIKGFVDMMSVATIMPFLSLLSNPDLVNTNPIANYFYRLFDFQNFNAFVMMVGIALVCFLVAVSVLRSVTAYALHYWSAMREYSLSLRLFSAYIRQPYEFFLNRRTDELNTYILSEAGRVVKECYKPAGEIINSLFTFVMIALFLLWVEPITTILSVVVFGGCYYALYIYLKAALKRWGDEVVVTNKARFRASGEALGGIKQIKLSGRESNYISAFLKPSKRQAKVRAITATLRQIPKFGLEALAFGGIIVLTLVLVTQNGGVENGAIEKALPTLGLYAFAGYRLLPTMQTMYASFSALRFGGAAVDAVYDDLQKIRNTSEELPKTSVTPLGITNNVAFQSVSYRYPEAAEGGLTDISFEIDRGMRVGVVGTTGAGKTTLVDVFLGLLPASSGEIAVDGKVLTKNLMRQWQASIGYVPQDVFLIDASVAENIALGVPKDKIDNHAVRKATASAQLHEFVDTKMPDGYDTNVGERGVRLSGGQRQRIGIARALYYNPEIIVFDEATSALDNATERELMREINALSNDKTIIMIAHRLSTVKECDFILVLDKGRLVGKATYEELLNDNTYFKGLTA